jgi:GNAT superfamily N-acetyltransferase
MTVHVRLATSEDVEQLCAVNIRSIREICAPDYPPERVETWLANKTPVSFLRWLNDPKLRLYAGEVEGLISGVALLDINGWVFLLYVTPDVLGHGLGKAMLIRLESDARKLGLARLQLKSTLTARVFYERQGYRNLGPTEDAIASYRMEKLLNSDSMEGNGG